MEKFSAVIVAAGKGSRMGTKQSKQFLLLQGKPILVHTLLAFEKIKELDSIVVVVGAEDVSTVEEYTASYGLQKVAAVVAGGTQRQDSVYQGLLALPESVQWVLIHDGVRPLVNVESIHRCWEKVLHTDAAILAVPVKDTIKIVDVEKGHVKSTPDRRSLWAIQTPQAFRLSVLLEAYRQAGEDGFMATDDSMLVERLGKTVHIVEGSYANIKITTPEDLLWAERLLEGEGMK